MLLTILIVIGYFGGLLTLFFLRILDQKDLISNLTIAFGWIVALLIAFIHLKRARDDSASLKKEEIKRKLEIEAFQRINNALKEYTDKMIKLSAFFQDFPRKLQSHLDNPLIFKFDLSGTIQEIVKLNEDILTGKDGFDSTFRANEIIFLEFEQYRKFFIMQTNDLFEMVKKFGRYFVKANIDQLRDNSKFQEFKEKCKEIENFSSNMWGYLFDLRILMMNSKLGELFDSLVPRRVPLDPKYKLLTEIATKEKVEKQTKEVNRKAIEFFEQ